MQCDGCAEAPKGRHELKNWKKTGALGPEKRPWPISASISLSWKWIFSRLSVSWQTKVYSIDKMLTITKQKSIHIFCFVIVKMLFPGSCATRPKHWENHARVHIEWSSENLLSVMIFTHANTQPRTLFSINSQEQMETHRSSCAHIHTWMHPFCSASIHRTHPLSTTHVFPLFLCSISPPLIAPPVSLPSNSLPFMPSISYRSDSIFISALLSPWSPVPLRLLPAVFVHWSLCTEMRWL